MWWKAVKIAGIVSAVLLTLFFFLVLVATTRPALINGVSGDELARSIDGEASSYSCVKQEDADWFCDIDGAESYRVEVDWMGCWKADPLRSTATNRDGCIELGDIITFD